MLKNLPALLLLSLLAACAEAPAPAATIALFKATPATTTVGQAVTFSWQTAAAARCALTTGSGERLTAAPCAAGSVAHSYNAPGTYEAQFEATSAAGESVSRETTVVVGASGTGGMEAAFSTASDGLTVSFDASASAAPAGTLFGWDFGDGARGEGEKISHTYAGAGDFQVSLTLSGGASSRVEQTVSVAGERLTLFGGDLSAWQRAQGGPANWRLGTDKGTPYVEVVPGSRVGANDMQTRESFGDFKLHLEFWVPQTPATAEEQARGNSGVYLQGRYEVQILDSFGHPLASKNDAGAIYKVKDAERNVSRPAETWQSYDVTFRAARYAAGKKIEAARVSVIWNGTLVQDNVAIPGPTLLGDPETGANGVLSGPIRLQDHKYPVRYRNIWLKPL